MTSVPLTITTERVTLREPRLADARRVALLAGDYAVASMTARMPYPYGLADAEDWLAAVAAEGGAFAIDFDGELIGCCGFAVVDETESEIGYWLGRAWWGRGLATEAVAALVRHAFSVPRRRRLVASHFVDNPASGRVLQKNGFRESCRSEHWCQARRVTQASITYTCRRPGLVARARRLLGDHVS